MPEDIVAHADGVAKSVELFIDRGHHCRRPTDECEELLHVEVVTHVQLSVEERHKNPNLIAVKY